MITLHTARPPDEIVKPYGSRNAADHFLNMSTFAERSHDFWGLQDCRKVAAGATRDDRKISFLDNLSVKTSFCRPIPHGSCTDFMQLAYDSLTTV